MADDATASECPFCRAPRTPVTCTCRGCVDLAWVCVCDPAVEVVMAREGLCDGCAEAGCLEGLAEFVRCRRLRPAP